jgi:hypothetical protein
MREILRLAIWKRPNDPCPPAPTTIYRGFSLVDKTLHEHTAAASAAEQPSRNLA